MKRSLNVLAWLVAILMALNAIALVIAGDRGRLDAAFAKCAEMGWQKADLEIRGQTLSSSPFRQAAELTLKPKDPANRKTIHVTLRRSLYLLGWRIKKYSETIDPS